jgi:hypothetical protein
MRERLVTDSAKYHPVTVQADTIYKLWGKQDYRTKPDVPEALCEVMVHGWKRILDGMLLS